MLLWKLQEGFGVPSSLGAETGLVLPDKAALGHVKA